MKGGLGWEACVCVGWVVGGGLNVKLLSAMTTKPATRDVSLRISIYCSFSKGVSVFVYVGLALL